MDQTNNLNQNQPTKKYSNLAIASFIFGILCLFFGSLFFIMQALAILFGVFGLGETKRKQSKGKWLAIAGLSLGILYFFVWIYIYSMQVK